MSVDFRGLSKKMRAMLASGRADLVAASLRGLNPQDIPREFALEIATLARQADQIKFGLGVLRPIVFSVSSFISPTPLEAAEYAILLYKNGSLAEAQNIMNDLTDDSSVELNLYNGLSHMRQWDFAAAIKPLENYIAGTSPGPLQLTAKLHLAAALVGHEDDEAAEALLRQNIDEAVKIGQRRMEAECYELLTEVYVNQNNFAAALELLQRADDILKNDSPSERLLITKWRAIIEAKKTRSIEALDAVKPEAQRLNQFEILRDLDYHALTIQFNADLYSRLFCGTPHPAYRRRLMRHFAEHGLRPVNCLIGSEGAPVLNSKTCRLESGNLTEATTQICNTFAALNEDFYRPVSMGRLFEKIFMNEFFNPDSSPNRVRQLILRTRHWIVGNYLPLAIEHSAHGYRMRMEDGIALRIWADQVERGSTSMLHKWNLFESRIFDQDKTTRQQIEFLLNQSPASASRFINWAVQEKKLIPLGRGQFVLAKSV